MGQASTMNFRRDAAPLEIKYTRLADISRALIGEVVNVWASVLEFSGVKPTKGSGKSFKILLTSAICFAITLALFRKKSNRVNIEPSQYCTLSETLQGL